MSCGRRCGRAATCRGRFRHAQRVRPEQVLERLGGVADAATLLEHVPRWKIASAVKRGELVRLERGRYALPGLDDALAAAHRLSGLLCEDSAVRFYGWPLKRQPSTPAVVVPRKRNLSQSRRRGVRVRFVDVPPYDVNRVATTPLRTVLDCASRLPFDEALAVADSALRCRDVSQERLIERARAMPPRYRARCLRVAEAADARAARSPDGLNGEGSILQLRQRRVATQVTPRPPEQPMQATQPVAPPSPVTSGWRQLRVERSGCTYVHHLLDLIAHQQHPARSAVATRRSDAPIGTVQPPGTRLSSRGRDNDSSAIPPRGSPRKPQTNRCQVRYLAARFSGIGS